MTKSNDSPKGRRRRAFKVEVFVREFLIDGNGARAIRAAGGAEASAKVRAAELLKEPEVQELLKERQKAVIDKLDTKLAEVLEELRRVGLSRIEEVADLEDGVLYVRNWDDMPERVRAAIAEITPVEHGVKVKLHPKIPALLALGKHLGMKDTQRHEHTGPDGAPLPEAPPATINYYLPGAPRWKRKPDKQRGSDGSG